MALNSLYTCFALTAGGDACVWRLFERRAGDAIEGDPTLIMSRAHTNIPRTGDTGIPMGWDARINTWRASTNMRFADGPITEWAANTVVELYFNERQYSTAPLLDLLAASQPVFEDVTLSDLLADRYGTPTTPDPLRPMWIRDNIAYGVVVTSPQKAADDARKWLLEYIPQGRFLCWIHLDGVILMRTRTI